jgi:pimeloyl-ACP methyl ester carboxylesterase
MKEWLTYNDELSFFGGRSFGKYGKIYKVDNPICYTESMHYSYFHSAAVPLLHTFRSLALILVFLTAILALFYAPATYAQETCGDIFATSFFTGEVEQTAIEDCSDPFDVVDSDRVIDVIINQMGEPLTPGQTVILDDASPGLRLSASYNHLDESFFTPTSDNIQLFVHDGDDYRSVNQNEVDIAGTYTVVHTVEFLPVAVQNWSDSVRDWLIPTAHAQGFGPPLERTAITFTVSLAEPDPTGASSVLFLPGIQASRLYTTEPDGSEKLLWEPNFLRDDSDVLRLAMTEDGNSIEDVYVKDVIDYAPQDSRALASAVYGGFLVYLENLVASEIISSYESFAYDWRYSVFDVVSDGVQYENERLYLVDVVEQLAADSDTEQVAIIAHSNGGLLGKALINELERQGKSELVESLIMIGTPQLGTPKAIGSLLHGTDQGIKAGYKGLFQVVTDEAVREAARNMPGAYGLLPGQSYLESAGDVVVLFDAGERTQVWRDSYGNALQSQTELDDFLTSSANGRESVPYSNTDEAIVANQAILDQARINRVLLDNWIAPPGVSVTSISGTGLETMSGFKYRTLSERLCSFGACGQVQFYRPAPIMSFRGDQTVMSVSAEGGSVVGQERYYVDLLSVRKELGEFYIHKNLTEAEIIHDLVQALLLGTTTESQFINRSGFTYPDQQVLMYGGNSPVYVLVTDENGRQTGQIDENTIIEEIPRSTWIKVGGASYVLVPADIEHTVTLNSYDEGSVTLSIDQVTDGTQELLHMIPIPEISSTTVVELTYSQSEFGIVQVDFEGNGIVDEERTLDGYLITTEDNYTYHNLRDVIDTIEHRSTRKYLDWLAKKAERYNGKIDQHPVYARLEQRLLRIIEKTVQFAERRGRVTEEQAGEIETIVSYLQNN